jgi:hypothetical protein
MRGRKRPLHAWGVEQTGCMTMQAGLVREHLSLLLSVISGLLLFKKKRVVGAVRL